MSPHFPRMLYKDGGPHEIHGGLYHHRLVHDDNELAAALGNGWAMTPAEASAPKEEVPMNAPPTREELERKAKELYIVFDGRTTDAKLAAKIASKVRE